MEMIHLCKYKKYGVLNARIIRGENKQKLRALRSINAVHIERECFGEVRLGKFRFAFAPPNNGVGRPPCIINLLARALADGRVEFIALSQVPNRQWSGCQKQ